MPPIIIEQFAAIAVAMNNHGSVAVIPRTTTSTTRSFAQTGQDSW